MIKTEHSKKSAVIWICVALAVLAIAVAVTFFILAGRLSRALKKMDITDKASVTLVLKYAKDDPDILLDIGKKYLDSQDRQTGAVILWHLLQNADSENQQAQDLLTEYYADTPLATQVGAVHLTDTQFSIQSESDGIGYGGTDGVYISDFDGYIRCKISSARAISFCAAPGGVYILDAADNSIKFISRDGSNIELLNKNVSEFIYFESYIYAIGTDGKLQPPHDTEPGDGELYKNLHIFDGQVLCDVYDSAFNLQKTITLN